MLLRHTLTSTWLLIALLSPMLGGAQEFRMETDVFVGSQKEPIAQNLTLFTDGLVYDFPFTGPQEVTVLDRSRGRFVLLDAQRKVKTTVTTQEILELAAAIKVHASSMEGVFAFAANPDFGRHFDPDRQEITLSSKLLTYRLRGTKPKLAQATGEYQRYADWIARLNATCPGNLPPFARMELNEATAEHDLLPKEVELTIFPKNRFVGRKLIIRSRHTTYWQLTNTDRRRIEEAGDQMANFQAVSFEQYREKEGVASSR